VGASGVIREEVVKAWIPFVGEIDSALIYLFEGEFSVGIGVVERGQGLATAGEWAYSFWKDREQRALAVGAPFDG
jgi:hypothetical protein